MSTIRRPASHMLDDKPGNPLKRLQIHFPDHTPHWQRHTGGYANIEFTLHERAGWLHIDATERSLYKQSSKRVMLSLDATDVAALRLLLDKLPR